MKITYFYRNHHVGYSIQRVSDLYANQMEDKEIFEMPSQYASIRGILKNMWYTFKHRNKHGINHITGDVHYCILPLMFCHTVLTIHDTCAYDCAKGFKKWIIKYLWFKIPLLLANKIVCISQATKTAVCRFTHRTDIKVIPNAIDPYYQYTPKIFDAENPNILLVGTNWNKNVERTLMALRDIPCHITIIGRLSQKQKEALIDCHATYTNKEHLTDEEIIEEYKQADIVSFCSEYEGFGMPIIEANAIGRAVVTSRLSPMTEVGGDAPFYVDPYDIQNIRTAFRRIISDEDAREKHIKLGVKNVERFQLKKIVAQYKKLYQDMLTNRKA